MVATAGNPLIVILIQLKARDLTVEVPQCLDRISRSTVSLKVLAACPVPLNPVLPVKGLVHPSIISSDPSIPRPGHARGIHRAS